MNTLAAQAHTTTPPQLTRADQAATRRSTIINLAVNLAAPLALYYGLRASGVDQWWSLMAGVVPPLVLALWTVATQRRVDALAMFTLSILVGSTAVSFLTGSPRFLLAKDGWITGIIGLWMLGTLLRTPWFFIALRSLTTGGIRDRVVSGWQYSPTFHRMMRACTIIWGGGLILDAVIRVALAYSLPIDQVPLIATLQYVVVMVVLEVSCQRGVLRRAGLRARVNAEIEAQVQH